MNLVHTLLYYFFKIHFRPSFHLCLHLSSGLFYFRHLDQNFACVFHSSQPVSANLSQSQPVSANFSLHDSIILITITDLQTHQRSCLISDSFCTLWTISCTPILFLSLVRTFLSFLIFLSILLCILFQFLSFIFVAISLHAVRELLLGNNCCIDSLCNEHTAIDLYELQQEQSFLALPRARVTGLTKKVQLSEGTICYFFPSNWNRWSVTHSLLLHSAEIMIQKCRLLW